MTDPLPGSASRGHCCRTADTVVVLLTCFADHFVSTPCQDTNSMSHAKPLASTSHARVCSPAPSSSGSMTATHTQQRLVLSDNRNRLCSYSSTRYQDIYADQLKNKSYLIRSQKSGVLNRLKSGNCYLAKTCTKARLREKSNQMQITSERHMTPPKL